MRVSVLERWAIRLQDSARGSMPHGPHAISGPATCGAGMNAPRTLPTNLRLIDAERSCELTVKPAGAPYSHSIVAGGLPEMS